MDMDIKRTGPDQLVFSHDGVASARPMLLIAVACVAVVALATLFGGSWLSLIVVLAVGGFLVAMLWRSSALARATFDRARGTLEIVHLRHGAEVGKQEMNLTDIAAVIVQPSTGGSGTTAGRSLALRPSLLVGSTIVPLTYRAFEGGRRPLDAAEEIRRFLGLAEDDLIEASVRVLARHSDRVQPAVRLARLGLGLGRVEAADMVTRLRKPT
jgi:hypothetical protein